MEANYPAEPPAIPGVSTGSESFDNLKKFMLYRQMFGMGSLPASGGGAPIGMASGMASGLGNSYQNIMGLMQMLNGGGNAQ